MLSTWKLPIHGCGDSSKIPRDPPRPRPKVRGRLIVKGSALGHHGLDLIVADQHEGAAQRAQHVGRETLEDRADALVLDNLHGAVDGAWRGEERVGEGRREKVEG
eukprot:scaffold31263_cov39-Phaeocystis_antarctica.AAC.2